jgi:hypothetical protein
MFDLERDQPQICLTCGVEIKEGKRRKYCDKCKAKRKAEANKRWLTSARGKERIAQSQLLYKARKEPEKYKFYLKKYLWLARKMGWDKEIKEGQ